MEVTRGGCTDCNCDTSMEQSYEERGWPGWDIPLVSMPDKIAALMVVN